MSLNTTVLDEYPTEILLNKVNGYNDMTGNSNQTVATRMGIIVIVLSWYVYGKYGLLSFIGLKRHKNFNFLFPMTASLFAFVNNTNDLINFVYHPSTCKPFYIMFVASATLNWAPISWLQAYRLALIAKIYLRKRGFLLVTFTTATLSITYCVFYFCNLHIFDFTQSDIMGCAVTNPGTYSYYVMVSDIVDSTFAFIALIALIFKSVKNLKELNTRNEKLNDLLGQGVFELIIIALAKIAIYPLIALTSKIPALDVFWDILSIIVIICGYNLVNFPYEHCKQDSKQSIIRKNLFNLIDSTINYGSSSSSNNRYSTNIISKSSKSQINEPVVMNSSTLPNNENLYNSVLNA
ncbi:hypothetical protein BCR32DRAFT_272455 [Anaeromyces robustus]|uniref:G-protein coupled receptors family 1 profile domain-containing protein n=1 Tax=Anaeromyces robustus TaxID=1754192 RepID=A0A1Y1W7K9_9FUNG|nr:hypothetical protein BCR32DRAFT_272455 [Anaeromyces robustus]|eukprot:ORX69318.1 hypothetical protein BCR32DRAFT_272455 [Anaeromyces robustus]